MIYHRGNNREECRLLANSPDNQIPWRRKLCDSCPVPEIVITSTTRDLALEKRAWRGGCYENASRSLSPSVPNTCSSWKTRTSAPLARLK